MYEHNDPTRIPRVMEALQRTWEGQPDLTLGALLGVLANHGVGWASTDSETVEILAKIEHEHPSLIDAHPPHHLNIETISPERLVTLAGDTVVVRDGRGKHSMPSVWRFVSLRRTGPGRPLVMKDEQGIEHRVGVVKLATRIADTAHEIGHLRRSDVGGRRWFVQLRGDARVIVGPRVKLWVQARRTISFSELDWSSMYCEVGAEMILAPADGGEAVELGRVERIVALEVN
ncbi:hypothetical protein [Corynebacterium mayonis]|uniref:hypothetical protein n=1 Tax=Corynebacterium mayonis TaxID=3062461 RepID=UPI00313FFAC6